MPSPRSETLFGQAREVMPSGYTRHMVVAKPYPLYADYGVGCRIIDVDGHSTIDFVNNFTALIHGHSKKEIVEVIAAQAGRLLSAILPTEWEVRLAELLVERIPGVEQVRFTNTGSEAVMIAVKVARAYTGKPKIAKMEGGYHGQFDLIEASFQPPPNRWGDPARPTAVANNVGTPQSLLDELVLLPVNDIENTRARLRGEFIRRAQERRRDFTVDWVHLKLNDQAQRTVLCKDPFRSVDERVEKLIASM